jgi:hypothetical protein
MPPKPAPRRLNRRKARSNARKASMEATTRMLVYRPGPNRMPFPPRFRTIMYCEADYSVPIATGPLYSGYFLLNWPTLPFHPGGSSAFPSLTFLGPATEATLQPTGYTLFANLVDFYNNFKVYFTEVSVKQSAASSDNNVDCVIVPSSSVSTPSDIYLARTQPFAKVGSFNTGRPNEGCDKDGFLKARFNVAELLGLTKIEAKADTYLSASNITSSPTAILYSHVFFQTCSLDVTANSKCLVRLRLKYEIEFWNQTQASLPVV